MYGRVGKPSLDSAREETWRWVMTPRKPSGGDVGDAPPLGYPKSDHAFFEYMTK